MLLRASFTTAGVLLACASASAQSPSESIIQNLPNMRQYSARAQGAVVLPPAPIVGSDNCATPTLVVGAGPHNFDTTGATSSPEGQATTNCIFYNLIGIDSDVWFEWVAPATGTFEISSCGLTGNDTKMAVYTGTSSGTTCPTAGGTATDCNDDINNFGPVHLQSRLIFAATTGTHYLIQIGGYPGTPPFTTDPPAPQGPGQFDIQQQPVQAPFIHDDGSTENATRRTGSSETLWMQAMGNSTTGVVNVTAIRAAIGSLMFAGLTGVTNGSPIRLGVWEDPTDDGNPSDAVLLVEFASTVSLADTDQAAVYTLPAPVQATNVFFIGASYVHGLNTGFPAPVDVIGCGSRPNEIWLGGSTIAVDFANLAANPQPVVNVSAGSTAYILQADTGSASTGTVFCIGDGVAPHTPCPCGNNSATADAAGCLNSLGTGGKLRGMGVASISADSLVLQGSAMANSSVLYFQGTIQQNGGNGAVFGDGLRCAGGVVVRLGTTTNVGGSSTYPFGAAPSVSVKGGVVAPGSRTYQAWYRNAAAFCTISTFNLTNGLAVTWNP